MDNRNRAGAAPPGTPLEKIERAIAEMKSAQCFDECENLSRLIAIYERLADRLRADETDDQSNRAIDLLILSGLLDDSSDGAG